MGKIVHARLDEETAKLIDSFSRKTGWPESEIIRRGIRALVSIGGTRGPRKIIGQGRFSFGISDLGSNKKHLEGFGRS
jgi:hypothetical protein